MKKTLSNKRSDFKKDDTMLAEQLDKNKHILNGLMIKLKDVSLEIKNKQCVLDKLVKMESRVLKKKHTDKLTMYANFLKGKETTVNHSTCFCIVIILISVVLLQYSI